MKFTSEIQSFGKHDTFIGPYFIIPTDIATELLKTTTDKRVKCVLNNEIIIPRAISKKEEKYYILINQDLLKKMDLTFGDKINVELFPDISKYGMPISEEMQEVLFQDPEGEKLFHNLTPGKQRSLLFYINKIKSSQLKIERSFVILQHLKNNNGKLDIERLQQDFKNFNKL